MSRVRSPFLWMTSFNLRLLLLLLIVCNVLIYSVLQIKENREFVDWHSGPPLETVVVGRDSPKYSSTLLKERILDFKNRAVKYRTKWHQDFLLLDCEHELTQNAKIVTGEEPFDHYSIWHAKLHRKFVAMLAINGTHGEAFLYELTLQGNSTFIEKVWITYIELFGVNSEITLAIQKQLDSDLAVFVLNHSDRLELMESLTKYINSAFKKHEPHFAEQLSFHFSEQLIAILDDQRLHGELRSIAQCVIYSNLRAVQERTMSESDFNK